MFSQFPFKIKPCLLYLRLGFFFIDCIKCNTNNLRQYYIFKEYFMDLVLHLILNKMCNVVTSLTFINKVIREEFNFLKVFIWNELVYIFTLLLEGCIFLFCLFLLNDVLCSDRILFWLLNITWFMLCTFLALQYCHTYFSCIMWNQEASYLNDQTNGVLFGHSHWMNYVTAGS